MGGFSNFSGYWLLTRLENHGIFKSSERHKQRNIKMTWNHVSANGMAINEDQIIVDGIIKIKSRKRRGLND